MEQRIIVLFCNGITTSGFEKTHINTGQRIKPVKLKILENSLLEWYEKWKIKLKKIKCPTNKNN